jgi:hypothetical protein
MATVTEEVTRLIQALYIAAGDNTVLERETTEIIPLALAHAASFERTSTSNANLCAQISVINALRGLPAAKPC